MRRWPIRLSIVGVFAALWLSPVAAQAADPHAAQPERPSVATHAHTVAPGWVEVELGYGRFHIDNQFGGEAIPLAFKLGLKPRLQLTVGTVVARPAGEGTTSVGAVGVGIKWRFAERVPVAGDVALLPVLTMPTESDAEAAGSLLLIASRTLGPLTLDLNAGYTRRRGDGMQAPKIESLWAAAVGGPLRGRFGWVGELSGSPYSSGPAGRARTVNSLVGATANITSSLVVDVAISVPVSGPDAGAIMTGVVWNVGRLWAGRPRVP